MSSAAVVIGALRVKHVITVTAVHSGVVCVCVGGGGFCCVCSLLVDSGAAIV